MKKWITREKGHTSQSGKDQKPRILQWEKGLEIIRNPLISYGRGWRI
jgi:hypothetical protein